VLWAKTGSAKADLSSMSGLSYRHSFSRLACVSPVARPYQFQFVLILPTEHFGFFVRLGEHCRIEKAKQFWVVESLGNQFFQKLFPPWPVVSVIGPSPQMPTNRMRTHILNSRLFRQDQVDTRDGGRGLFSRFTMSLRVLEQRLEFR